MESKKKPFVYEQLSMLIAITLTTFALAQFFDIPGRLISLEFAGIYFNFNIKLSSLFSLLNVGIVVTGSYSIFLERAKKRRISLAHAILPALTSWMISIPLFATDMNLLWWVELSLFGAILLLVIYAEYLVSDDIEEKYEQLLTMLLVSIAFGIFFIISAMLFALEIRLTFMLLTLTLLTYFISLRVFELHIKKWLPMEASIVTLIIAQVAAALNYFQFSAITLGIFLFAVMYSLTNFIIKTHHKPIQKKDIIETTFILFTFIILGIILQIT